MKRFVRRPRSAPPEVSPASPEMPPAAPRRRRPLREDGTAPDARAVAGAVAVDVPGDAAPVPAPPRPRQGGPRAQRRRRTPLVLEVDPETSRRFLLESLQSLQERTPGYSAEVTVDKRQKIGAAVAGFLLLVSLVLAPRQTVVGIAAAITCTYFAAVAFRLVCFGKGLGGGHLVTVTDADARAATTAELPPYTVLVPAYKEPEVIATLLGNLAALDYPTELLQVLILLEQDDELTLDAVRAANPPSHVRVVVVPPSELKTKPKACNYGLQLATGELVTIYDAEDRPEPLQLRRAAVAFSRLPTDVICLQAKLGYFNADQNRITQWFTAEYVTWFAHFLPGLVALNAPVPLGGTSNHIRTDVLRELGAWDPFNVTEDADLGVRLHRKGLRTAVLDSMTLEEANSDFVNWVKQRSRWYKGYLQTWLVHLRRPLQLYRELGFRGFVGFNLFVGGTPLLSVLNPVFWSMTLIYFLGRVTSGADRFPARQIEMIFPAPWYYVALLCFIVGNLSIVYIGVVSMHTADREELLPAALMAPAYWVMMSIAGIKAALQLVYQPSFWEKTVHGLFPHRPPEETAVDTAAPSPAVDAPTRSPDARSPRSPR